MDSSAALESRTHSLTVQKEIDILFPANKRRQSRRTSSFSSISSLSSCSSSLGSPYFPDDFPTSHAQPFLSSGVPFSWENFPGIPKNQAPIEKENSSLTNLPLPPTLTPPTSKRFCLEQTKKTTQTDPFFAALVECSKDEDPPDFRQTNKKLSDNPKVSRSVIDRICLINLYASCKRASTVYESISYIPRSSRRSCHGSNLINMPHRPIPAPAAGVLTASYNCSQVRVINDTLKHHHLR